MRQPPDFGLGKSNSENRDADNASSLPHAAQPDELLTQLSSSQHGLTHAEAELRLKNYGPNAMPKAKPPGIIKVFIHQFASPLIYILVAAAVFSMLIQEWSDAMFIGVVLLVNAIIGTIQEYSAQRAAAALAQLVTTNCRVIRENDTYEIDARELVPGDIVLLESGDSVPADIRLLSCHGLEVDESLLTGESIAVMKNAKQTLPEDCSLGDRVNMAFAGTLVNRGRGSGIVTGTATHTQLGHIAAAVLNKPPPKAPLMIRMEAFTHKVAILVASAAILMAAVSLMRGMPPGEIFMLAVALAVSAIPEGLPVALTVALAISMHRMTKRNVIVRRLVAVEALGSCTYIATDKTGTLTENQLTARRLLFPDASEWEISGDSLTPEGSVTLIKGSDGSTQDNSLVYRLCQTAVLANEAFLGRRDNDWIHHGDAVDVALLTMAHKLGVVRAESLTTTPERASIPFESGRQFAASLNEADGVSFAHVKGAVEKLLPLCSQMANPGQDAPIDVATLEAQASLLANQGYRVIALACGPIKLSLPNKDSSTVQDADDTEFTEEHLHDLTLIGLVGIIDPLRSEARQAVAACQEAGVKVAMVTGDHPATALSIAREATFADSERQIVTGPKLKRAATDAAVDQLTAEARVFARVEPQQKLDIVESLQRNGHFVAVSGDGANDAPALRAAHVGVAMGKQGTDVARETAELVITDDNFSSIVAGIEEGRIAYANVRKVIFLLISTGAAEIVLFTMALLLNLPLPLLAVQLLWLNLVTNGIQHVALAFEPGEGDELKRPPRDPQEPIFNRIMVERVIVSALVMGVMAFIIFRALLDLGMDIDSARNSTLLLMVLFENVHVFNCRSESRSVFRHNLLRNPLLLFGTLAAQAIHIGAMYTPWLKDVLAVQPVSAEHWLELLGLALSLLVVMELHKWFRRRFVLATGAID
jgi:magnesium-transporting ATPase (P-type)